MRVFTIFVNIAISVTCYGRGAFPIYDGRLDSDLNANNFSITNLYSLDVKNVPWVTTNQLDTALEGIVTEEHDLIAIAQLDAHKVANNPHAITPAQIGAITTNQLDAALEGIVVAESDPFATPIAQDALDKANRLYHYGDINIVPSPDDWFTFSGGEITGFNYVTGREHVVIPYEIGGEPVASIGDDAFPDVDSGIGKPVISVVAPKTVTLVGSYAFYYCSALTAVSLPSVTSVGEGAFYYCSALTSISLPMATSVGSAAFYYCSALTSISLPMVTSVGSEAFSGCSALTAVSLPSATSVDYGVFNSCSALTAVSLPSATSVGEGAFYECTALTSITLGKTRPLTWDAGTVATATIYVPHDSTEYSDMFYDMPVIRATESADNFYLGGKTLEDRFDLKADKSYVDGKVKTDVPDDAVFTDTIVDISGYATTGAVAAVQAEVATLEEETLDPLIDWSAVITPVNGTATVTRATGAEPMLTLADDVVISVPTTGWPTTGVSRVSLSLWAGANSVTLLTNTVEYSSTPTISTNDWTTILFRRTGDQEKWRGVGL